MIAALTQLTERRSYRVVLGHIDREWLAQLLEDEAGRTDNGLQYARCLRVMGVLDDAKEIK